MHGRRTGIATGVLLAIGSVIVSVGLCEILARWLMPEIGWRPYHDTNLGWSTREYQQFDPLAQPRIAGQKRLLFVGDSYLAGAGISHLDERFPVLLGKRFGQRVAVQILATGSWGTDQELLAFLQKGVSWQPDTVVVAFCANNDLVDIISNDKGRNEYKPYFTVDDTGALRLFTGLGAPISIESTLPAQRWPIGIQSYVLDLLWYSVHGVRPRVRGDHEMLATVDPRYQMRRPAGVDGIRKKRRHLKASPQRAANLATAYIHESFEVNTYAWHLLEALLQRWRDEADAMHAKLKVLLLPASLVPGDPQFIVGGDLTLNIQTPTGPFTFRLAEPRDRLRAICEQLGIELIDPTRGFSDRIERQHLQEAVWPSANDDHFSAVGHQILADLIEPDLAQALQ